MCKKAGLPICLFKDLKILYRLSHIISFICFNEMKAKKKNRLHRQEINRPSCRHGFTYTKKYKNCLSMMMLICIKQHPTNTWGSIYEKVKEHWD